MTSQLILKNKEILARQEGRWKIAGAKTLWGHAWEHMSFHKYQTGRAEFSVGEFSVNVVAADDTGKIGQVHRCFLSRGVKGLDLCFGISL